MPGGIIELNTNGLSQDTLYLSGTPEITFFKTVYRRYTNFAIESIPINFEDPVEFGGLNTVKILQTGDLMHNVYLQVTLPQINLYRNKLPDPTDFQIAYANTVSNYNIVVGTTTTVGFTNVNRVAYANAYNIYVAENNIQNASIDMINAVNAAFVGYNEIPIQELILSHPQSPFTYNEISMKAIVDGFDENSDKNAIFKALSIGIDKSIKTQSFFYYQMYNANVALQDVLNKNIKFAWINRVGHFVAEYIEVKIGGHIIDKHYGIWINIWYELTANRSIQETYFKLIGNVPELTTFNRTVKPKYIMKIPLTFWFCNFSGLAIPLVALQYHTVSFHVRFRPFQELCYIETDQTIFYSLAPSGITLEEVPDIITSVILNANLLVDFYYLDSSERRRFAQSSHEFMITQVQLLNMTTTQQSIQVLLNSFVQPTLEMIWITQKLSYTQNTSGFNQCRFDNYSLTDANVGNPIVSSSMDFNSYKRIQIFDGNYFNYVIPYEVHYSSPGDGINVYSFSLSPEELQPSGSANFSRISRLVLFLNFSETLFKNGVIVEPLIVTVFTRSYNVLRIISGFSALTFSYLQ